MLEDIAIYIVIGIIAGLLAGTLGIGSGVFIVPALAFVFAREHFPPSLIMHMAAGTSLMCIAVTTVRALMSHLKRNVAFWSVYKRLYPSIIVGTISGAILSHYLHSRTLSIIFGIIVFLLGIKMFFPLPKSESRHLPGTLGCSTAGFLIGAKSGLLGLGGGALSTPFLTHYGVSLRQSVVVATAVSVTVSTVGAISFMLTGIDAQSVLAWTTGYVYWPAWFGVIVGSLTFVPLGVKLSHRLPTDILKRIFAVFLCVVGVHMLYVVWI
ncbi:MAG: sulfite exporter TauE/SafE family protein [Coxiellaceae bacterium]|nr:sulfite exporter TauE/SafE family protein [Coxiellaceae bacterium]